MIITRARKTEQTGLVVKIMNEIAVHALAAKNKLLELSRQTNTLAVGLQTNAPGEKKDQPNPVIDYLFAISAMAQSCAEELDQVIDPSNAPASQIERPKL